MRIQHSKINYKANLTQGMKIDIAKTDVAQIQTNLATHGINTDFKNNKFIAWATKKCFELIDDLNQKYDLRLALPKCIFVEDFNNIDITNKNIYGFCNFTPTKLFLNSDVKIPEKTIFFNEFKNYQFDNENKKWNNLDNEMKLYKRDGISVTDSFLEIFLHEFFHVVHAENMICTLGGKKYVHNLENILTNENLIQFRHKYKSLLSSICKYACENPLESIACDLSGRAIHSINYENFKSKNNFIKGSPYETKSILSRLFLKKNNLDKILHDFWNGDFHN